MHQRLFEVVKRASPDTFREFHICGQCEDILDDIPETGAESWQPAQPLNDVKAFQERHPGFGVTGAWDNVTACSATDISEAEFLKR